MANNELDYGPDILTLEDEDGVEHEFELLDSYDEGEQHYIAVVPVEDAENLDEDDGELIVLKVDSQDGEDFLMAIEDEDEFDRISNIFMERLKDYYDFTEES